jgi:hypothetical protein
MTKHCLRYAYIQDCDITYSCESCADYGYRTCDTLKKLGVLRCDVNLAVDCKDCDMSKPDYATTRVGRKDDTGKLRWDLLPIEPIEKVVEVLTNATKKYTPNSWRNVENAQERYYAALMRHIVAYRHGESKDAESGISHIAHALCNLIFLYELAK